VLRYAGAAYLVFLGIRAWRSRQAPAAIPVDTGRAYRQAIVVNLLNPKTALFFLAFLPQFVDPARGPAATQVLVLGAVLCGLGFALDCGYAALASLAAKRFLGTGLNRVSGAVYVALGAAAALTGGRH
jgi:threonine/homoserine/homoserine lactone efflux protein